MGIYDRLQRARADVTFQQMDPTNPFWYESLASYASTSAGFPMSPDRAMRVSTVFACVSLKAETVGGLPCHLYRRLDNGGRERATDHPMYRPVRWRPNGQHTAMEFYSGGETRVNMRGAALNWRREFRGNTELIPIPPANVLRVDLLDTGRLRFEIKDPLSGVKRTLLQDEVLYVRDLMEDGFAAVARASLAREAIAVAAAAEAFVGGYFKNNASNGRLAVEIPGAPSPEQRAQYRTEFNSQSAGYQNAAKTLLLWNGMKASELGGHEDSSFLVDPRKMQVAEIARYFGRIPLFMIGLEEKSTSWGSGIEQQTQAWINYGMLPSIIRWEQAMNRDLLSEDEQEEYFFEFNLDGLLRGDSLQRAQTNEIKRRNGVINPDEWRLMENMNPRTDPGGKRYQDNAPGAAPSGEAKGPRPVDDEDDEPQARIVPAPLMADAVSRIAGREIGDLAARVSRSSDPEKFKAWAAGYYAEHREYVVKVVTPLAEAFGLGEWSITEAADRVVRSAEGLSADGVVMFTARRREAVAAILDETFRAGATLRRAA